MPPRRWLRQVRPRTRARQRPATSAAGGFASCSDYQYRFRKTSSTSPPASAITISAITARRTTRRGRHCNIFNLPTGPDMTRSILQAGSPSDNPPKGGSCPGGLRRLAACDEPGFGEWAPCPGKRLPVPAGERDDGDALARGVDHPPAAEVDARMPDRRRL